MTLNEQVTGDWQNWARMILGAIIVLSGWFILDLRHSAEINSAIVVRLANAEKEIESVTVIANNLSLESASSRTAINQLNASIQRFHEDIQDRSSSLSGMKTAVDEIRRTVEIAANGQATNLREVNKIIESLGRQICSQQQCNHIQGEIDKKK